MRVLFFFAIVATVFSANVSLKKQNTEEVVTDNTSQHVRRSGKEIFEQLVSVARELKKDKTQSDVAKLYSENKEDLAEIYQEKKDKGKLLSDL